MCVCVCVCVCDVQDRDFLTDSEGLYQPRFPKETTHRVCVCVHSVDTCVFLLICSGRQPGEVNAYRVTDSRMMLRSVDGWMVDI